MKKLFLGLLVGFIVISGTAQELKKMQIVGKANTLEGEMVARRDQNGNYCAAIQVISDMDGFSYDSWDGIVGNVDSKSGKDMVFLTASERVLEIFRTGYEPMKIILSDIGIRLQSREVWQIRIAGDETANILPVTFRFTPSDAKLRVDDKPENDAGTYNLSPGQHTIKIQKEGYNSIDETITIDDKHVFFEWIMEKVKLQWVVINSNPEGADVYIDEKLRGQTPYNQEFREGNYYYKISKILHYDESGRFSLNANEGKKAMDFNLKPKYGFVNINSIPENGANIFVDDLPLNQVTPFKTDRIASGSHTILLTHKLYKDTRKEIVVTDGETTEITLDMKPDFGGVSINTVPENGAEVFLNGLPTGKTSPCKLDQLPDGEHQLTFRHKWYEPKSITIMVEDGITSQINEVLNPTFVEATISTSAKAEIIIDEQKVATGNYTGRLSLGIHTFEARDAKHKTAIQKEEIILGRKYNITLSPQPLYGTLKVISDPFDASITLDNKSYGTTPNTISELFIGDYNLKIEKPGYGIFTKIIKIKENEETIVNETLPMGMEVIIDSKPSGVTLFVDGINEGVTPQTVSLSFGKHDIKLIDGKREIKETITVQQNGKKRFIFSTQVIEMVFVKGGTFTMGHNINARIGTSDTEPEHQVTLSDFYMGKYEVTQKQWRDVMGSNPPEQCNTGCDNCPVDKVSWNDAQGFIRKLNQKTGKKYRLPTEAEWEFAARGGTLALSTIYDGSNTIDEVAWYNGGRGSKTHPVGQKKPNELGIYDMSGNVFELCNDLKGRYPSEHKTNPTGPSSGGMIIRRGGNYRTQSSFCKVYNRSYGMKDSRGNCGNGFRIVLTP